MAGNSKWSSAREEAARGRGVAVTCRVVVGLGVVDQTNAMPGGPNSQHGWRNQRAEFTGTVTTVVAKEE